MSIAEKSLSIEVRNKLNFSGNANIISVNNLTDLQNLNSGEIANIKESIDLVNTNVTIPSDVTLLDGGGDIITSGTGELTLSQNCKIDNTLINYNLNFSSNTEGRLLETTYVLNKNKYPIDQTISSPTYDNETDKNKAITNTLVLRKACQDANLLGCTNFQITKLDAYFYTATTVEAEKGINNVTNAVQYTPLLLLGGMMTELSDDVYLRDFPHDAYTGYLVAAAEVNNTGIKGGNLIGSRLTHNYAQYRDIITAATSSPVSLYYGPNDNIQTATIPVTINDSATQAQEIADYFTNNIAGYTGSVLSGTTDTFVIHHDDDGFYFRVSEDAVGANPKIDTSGINTQQNAYDVTYGHGIVIEGSKNVKIDGVNIEDMVGDGILVTAHGLSTYPGFVQSENITIENCTVLRSRRINISPVSGFNIIIRNNIVKEAGLDVSNNVGASPRGNIWAEPYKERDGTTGVLTEYEYSENLLIENNYCVNGEYAQIALFNSSNTRVIGNTTNGLITAQNGVNNYIAGNTINMTLEYNGRDTIGNRNAIKLDGVVNTSYTEIKRELSARSVVTGNVLIGNGDVAVASEIAFELNGWNVNISDNIVLNFKRGLKLTNLVDAIIHDNYFDTDPTFETTSSGLEITSGAFANVHIKNNVFKVYQFALNLNNVNSSGTIATYNLETSPSLLIEGNEFNSYDGNGSEIKATYYTVFKNNVFNELFNCEGIIGNTEFIGNDFKKLFTLATNLAKMDTVNLVGNTFRSSNTSASLSLRSISDSSNVLVADNIFYQPSNGSRAIWIRTEGSGTNDSFRVFNNKLYEGSPTEFLTFEGDNSVITNNINYYTGLVSQTITGSNNTIN